MTDDPSSDRGSEGIRGDPKKMPNTRLYLCTPCRADLESFVANCIEGGVDVVQLREKDADDATIVKQAKLAQRICRDRNVPFILNDRPDLALEVGADGVHLGQQDCRPSTARKILGPRAVIGWSTHCLNDLEAAATEPVDYLSAGPVVPTPTKPGRAGTGSEYLKAVAQSALLPWFVTGGVTPQAIPNLIALGAHRFVVVRYLTESTDPLAAARRLSEAIDLGLESKEGPRIPKSA